MLICYPPTKKICSKRSILTAKILSRKLKTCKYKLQFKYPPSSSKTLTKWISVNDIPKRKRKLACQSNKKKHKKKYLKPDLNHKAKFTDMQSDINFLISYDQTKDNCQFSALCHELASSAWNDLRQGTQGFLVYSAFSTRTPLEESQKFETILHIPQITMSHRYDHTFLIT